jgi:hypothetical protein
LKKPKKNIICLQKGEAVWLDQNRSDKAAQALAFVLQLHAPGDWPRAARFIQPIAKYPQSE